MLKPIKTMQIKKIQGNIIKIKNKGISKKKLNTGKYYANLKIKWPIIIQGNIERKKQRELPIKVFY